MEESLGRPEKIIFKEPACRGEVHFVEATDFFPEHFHLPEQVELERLALLALGQKRQLGLQLDIELLGVWPAIPPLRDRETIWQVHSSAVASESVVVVHGEHA
ncbi:UNVERIFIED_CONTAM: hypothetical protein HHA_450850 [Hammondia hammondi]|eukprot:XP_008883298.1 hypothetical protein HHA_450850 [Hammondia hammondi]